MRTLTHPTFFAPLGASRLLPARLGESAHKNAVLSLLKKRGARCEITGDPLPTNGFGIALEFRDPKAKHQGKLRLDELRIVDEWVFWSRHVESAIEHEKGSLIFMPWLTQAEVLVLVRMLHIGLQVAEEKGWTMMGETASRHLERLGLLGAGDLMINALGLPDDLENWDPLEWLSAIRDVPVRERKTYMQKFGQHVRFLPSQQGFEQATRGWRKVFNLEGDLQKKMREAEAYYTKVMVKLSRHGQPSQ